jgi:hypothetical protein
MVVVCYAVVFATSSLLQLYRTRFFVLIFIVSSLIILIYSAVIMKAKFVYQVNKVPSAFSSIEHYLQIHSALLLEEIRASLQSKISATERAKSYRVLSVVHTDTPDVYYIDIDVHQLSSCSHVAEDGDIFLIGESKHMIGCFAVVLGVGRNTGFHRSFRLLIPNYHNNVKLEAIKEEVTFLTNIMEAVNISKAMRYIEHGDSAAVESVLCIDGKVKR